MSVTDININQISPLISNEMFKNIFNEINVIIKKICIENNLNPEDVIAKHTSDISKLGLKYGIKKRNKRKLNKNEQCMGRKIDGKQCTRGRRPNCEFCKSHENKLAHGRIDEPYQNKESIPYNFCEFSTKDESNTGEAEEKSILINSYRHIMNTIMFLQNINKQFFDVYSEIITKKEKLLDFVRLSSYYAVS